MCEVFLLRDLGPFEVSVRGEFQGIESLDVVEMVLEHLPPRCDVVVDLNDAVADAGTLIALVQLVRQREDADVSVAVAASDERVRTVLLTAGLDPRCSLAYTVSGAASLLAHRSSPFSIAS